MRGHCAAPILRSFLSSPLVSCSSHCRRSLHSHWMYTTYDAWDSCSRRDWKGKRREDLFTELPCCEQECRPHTSQLSSDMSSRHPLKLSIPEKLRATGHSLNKNIHRWMDPPRHHADPSTYSPFRTSPSFIMFWRSITSAASVPKRQARTRTMSVVDDERHAIRFLNNDASRPLSFPPYSTLYMRR